MTSYTVTLTDAENKSLLSITPTGQDWIDNVVHERCRIAMDDIIQRAVTKCLSEGIQIPSSRESIVELAFSKGWETTAQERVDAAVAADALAYQPTE